MHSIENLAVQTRHIGGFIDFMVTDGEYVWATNQDQIQKFSVAYLAPLAEIDVPNAAGIPALGFGAVWAASLSEQCIYKIDCQNNEILAKVPTSFADRSGEFSLCATAHAICWISAEGQLSCMHPEDLLPRVVADVLPHSYNLCFAGNALWLTNPQYHSVQRLDAEHYQVTHKIPTGKKPWFLHGSDDYVFTLNQDAASVSKIDVRLNRHIADYSLPEQTRGEGGDIWVSAQRIYVRSTQLLCVELDINGNILREIHAPDGTGSGAVVVSNEYIWLTAHDVDRLWLIEKQAD